jgi:hypothetical protein
VKTRRVYEAGTSPISTNETAWMHYEIKSGCEGAG